MILYIQELDCKHTSSNEISISVVLRADEVWENILVGPACGTVGSPLVKVMAAGPQVLHVVDQTGTS